MVFHCAPNTAEPWLVIRSTVSDGTSVGANCGAGGGGGATGACAEAMVDTVIRTAASPAQEIRVPRILLPITFLPYFGRRSPAQKSTRDCGTVHVSTLRLAQPGPASCQRLIASPMIIAVWPARPVRTRSRLAVEARNSQRIEQSVCLRMTSW